MRRLIGAAISIIRYGRMRSFLLLFCGVLFTAVSWYCLVEVSVISRECIHVVFLFRSRRTSWFYPVSSSGSGRVFPTLCASTLGMNTCISGCFDGRAMFGGITIFPTWNIHVLLFFCLGFYPWATPVPRIFLGCWVNLFLLSRQVRLLIISPKNWY